MKFVPVMSARTGRVCLNDFAKYYSGSGIRSGLFVGLIVLLMLLFGTPCKAFASHSHPNLVRGNADERIVEKLDRDKINLFNGNLSLAIPIGISYPLSESFSYQLSLNYNSNVWDLWQSSSTISTASPIKNSNAGFGWDLSLGRLVPPTSYDNPLGTWIYISPDGAAHPFYQSLHFDMDDYATNVYYTRDATYYRLTQTSPTICLLENRDGTVSTFQLINNEWQLVRVADRFTNYLSINYATANVWSLTDNHGRSHTIYFKSDPAGLYPAVVDRIVLAAFGGTSATYTFSYTTSSISRPNVDNDPATTATVTVPLLASVSMPDGSQYSLTYHNTGSPADWSGRIAAMELPTRGKIEWTYQTYLFTITGCTSPFSPIYRASTGVATRRFVDGGTVTGTWTYSPVVKAESDSKKCGQAGEMTNSVTTPLGDKTVYYFSVNTQGSGPGWNRSDYALPFTKSEADSSSSRYLSRQYYDCDEAGNNCRLLRSFYVRYEQDTAANPATLDVADVNRREVSQRVVYHDDVENSVERFADTDRSSFDGLGNFRQHITNGNFGSGDVRQTFINYNATTSTYPSAEYVLPSPGSSWILNTYSQYKVVEGQSSRVIDYCYDRVTGFLNRKRLWKSAVPGGSAGANDVIIVFTPDAQGQVSKQQYYGADTQSIALGNLCSLSLPAAQYEIRNAYEYGNITSSQFFDETGNPVGSKQIDRDNDKNTGLMKTSRDSAGLFTRLEYDTMGRLRWVKPQQGAWIENRYLTAMTSGSAKILKYQYPNGAVSGPLTYNAEVYDPFGRLLWEQTRMPDGTFPNRYKSYNAMGHLTGDTSFTTGAPHWVQYLNYDPFGRVQTIRPPTGSQHDINIIYSGIRAITRIGQVGTWYNAATGVISEQPRSTTSIYDRQSRLWKEIVNLQNSSTPDSIVVSGYDAAGELIQKTQDNTLIGKRRDYDGRGFLFRISDAEGNSSFYQNFDALGNARRQRPNSTDLNYEFDRAARLVRVRETNAPAKMWKEYVYADENGVNDWRAGKLWKTKRYNYFPNVATATISETYVYSGKAGQVSQYEIEWADNVHPSEKFVQGYVYDEIGNVTEIQYPQEVTANTNLGRTRKVVNTFSQKYLVGITGIINLQNEDWATAINYHANGLVSRVAHSNGVTENITNDPNGYARPASVSTTGVKQLYGQADQNYHSGSFQYDGMGNLVRVGNEYFLPREGYQPPKPSDYTPVRRCMADDGIDPFGMPYASITDTSCSLSVFSFYTVDDIEVKIEDRRDDSNVWTFYDQLGQPLTKYSRMNTTRSWISTQDYIYRGGILLAVDEKLPSAPYTRTFHYNPGYGGTGIITDHTGAKAQP